MRLFAAVAVVMAAPLAASAQTPPVSANPTPAPGFQMPGTAVGQPLLQPVGTQIPKAVPPAGTPVGSPPGNMAPTDLTGTLPGQTFDKKNIVGPIPDSMGLPTQPGAWDKFVAKFGASLGLIPPQPKAPNWTPGIARRNRERAEQRSTQMWRRD